MKHMPQNRGSGNAIDVVVAVDDQWLFCFKRGQNHFGGLIHTRQRRRLGHGLQIRAEESLNLFLLYQPSGGQNPMPEIPLSRSRGRCLPSFGESLHGAQRTTPIAQWPAGNP